MCVAEEVNSGLHPRVKGWPTHCCCGHTHVCFYTHTCLVPKKSIEALIILTALAWQTDCCCEHIRNVLQRGQLRVGRPIAAVNTQMCVAEGFNEEVM